MTGHGSGTCCSLWYLCLKLQAIAAYFVTKGSFGKQGLITTALVKVLTEKWLQHVASLAFRCVVLHSWHELCIPGTDCCSSWFTASSMRLTGRVGAATSATGQPVEG